MNVTLKNTRLLFYLMLFNIFICFTLLFLVPIAGFGKGYFHVVTIEFSLSLIITFVYLIRILSWFKENIAIVIAFSMFTCLFVMSIVDAAFPALLKFSNSTSLVVLLEVVSVLMAFRSFSVKAAAVAIPFKFFGIGIALMTVPKLIIMLISNTFNGQLINISIGLGFLIAFISICFILKETIDFFKSNVNQSVKIQEQ